jgi:cell division protein FtsZ
MRSKYTLATMAILASCYTASTTTSAFIVPAATTPSSLLQKQSCSIITTPSSLRAALSENNIEGEEEEILFTSAVASGWKPERGSFAGITRRRNTKTSSTALGMSDYDAYAVIPDGGLSPCVIKVVGVGGGGCNAVSVVYCVVYT